MHVRRAVALCIFLLLLTGSAASAAVTRVTLSAVGDITIGGDPRKGANVMGSEKYYAKLNKRYRGGFLKKVRRRLKGVTIANLESSFTTSRKFSDKSYIFRADPAYARILSRGGINVVTHANNHAGDFAGGARSTWAAVGARGIAYVGNGRSIIRKYKGVRIGFCAFNALNDMNPEPIVRVVQRLKKKCHLVVVSIHWGIEYRYRTSVDQRRLGRAAVDAGASLVLGHHSHVVGEIEKYRGAHIVYSLGTFSAPILTPQDMDTFIFIQSFKVDTATRRVKAGSPTIIPCSMSSRAKVNDGRPRILKGKAKKRVLRKIRSLG